MAKQVDNSIKFILILKHLIKILTCSNDKKCSNDESLRQLESLQTQINSLQNLLSFCVDITNLPKAKGDLRKLQQADAIALEIFDRVCNKFGLTYWLDGGTLIGAIRHKGFIPWDDDIDVGMPREDYEKIRNTLYKEFEKYGFVKNEGKGFYNQIVRLTYKNSAIQVDLWPFDLYYKKITTKKEEQYLSDKIKYCNKFFWGIVSLSSLINGSSKFPYEKLKELQDKIILNGNPAKESAYFYGSETFVQIPQIINHEDLFPLKQCQFEDVTLPIPNNFDYYIKHKYGDYMQLPTDNKFNHGNIMFNLKNIEKYLDELQEIRKNLR